MNKLYVLTKVLLKNLNALPADPKKKTRQILLMVVLALCFVPMLLNLAVLAWGMYDGLAAIGQEGALLSMGIAVAAFVIFFFGLFYTMNTFYFSDDVENLLPLPVKSSHILGAKFIIVMLFEYFTEGLILLPLLAVYGLRSGEGFLYYCYALLIFLTLPVIPLVLDSAVVMIIMRFTNLAKNKDAFRTVSAVIAIFFGVGVSTLAQRIGLNSGRGLIQQGSNSLVGLAAKIFPLSRAGELGLTNSGNLSGLAYTGLFLCGAAAGFYLFLRLGNLLYYKGFSGGSISTSRRQLFSGEELSRRTVRSSGVKSFARKELRILFRTPAFFINCVLMNFLWPVLMFLPTLARPGAINNMGELAGVLQNEGVRGLVLAAVFCMILFFSSVTGIASTAISREGENIQFNKVIPLSYAKQIKAKLIVGVIIGVVGMLLVDITVAVILKLPLSLLALIVMTGLLAVLFSNLTGVFIDLLNPKLHWDNEQKVVKQNMNVLLAMAVGVIFAGITFSAVFALKLHTLQTAVSLIAVYGVLDILVYLGLMSKGADLFSKIEY